MKFYKILSTWAAGISALTLLIGAFAPHALAQEEEAIEEIVVTGALRSLPTEAVGSVFGFDKTLLETPRSASTISSDQIERFDINDIDELIALAPGTFTQSFFGVAGSLDIRGTPGETYFRGVRRLDNPGNYPTPIGASDRIDIVRGPASPIYGPSKIGGYMNFVPKSARADSGQYLDAPEGRIGFTTGSWDKAVITAEVGGPGELGGKEFGYYLYGMLEDSGSYYDNSSTSQTLIQASFDTDVNDSLRFQFGGMYHRYDGNQNAGWNRLTQDLIDTGTYITGTAQAADTDGDGSISHFEYFDADNTHFFTWFRPEDVVEADINPSLALVNPGTAILNHNQTLNAPDDVLENEVTTLYWDIIYETSGGWELKNQLFFEKYSNLNENAYGFAQFHEAWVVEEKFIASKIIETGSLTSSIQISPSIRHTDYEHANDFINEFFDRRDLTGPSTAFDRRLLATRIDDQYTEYDVGDYTDLGIAVLGDFTWENGLSVLLGARYDTIDFSGIAVVDKTIFGQDPASADVTEDGVSWTASISWAMPGGIVPYVTASEQSTIVAGQGANFTTAQLAIDGPFDTSELLEFGIKGSFLDDTLYMALSVYEQERTDFSAQATVTNTVNNTEGIEFEVRWVPTDNLVLTAGWSDMKVVNLTTLDGGGRFSFFGAEDMPQVDPTLIYGGVIIGEFGLNLNPEAQRAGVPENILTLTGTYQFDNGVAINASIIDVDATFSSFSQNVKLPAYTLVNLGLVYETETWTFAVTGKNLTDEKYYRANFPNLFGSTIVAPELPVNWQASAAYHF